MKLPIPILGKKENAEYLLALLLRQEKASAVIVEKKKTGSRIVGKHDEFFQTNLEDAGDEEWLKVLDRTISKAEETLPPSIETHKTIFGVPTTWVEEKHIKKDYLLKLKRTSEELGLAPIGFLEIPEAIAHLLQEEEGAPISAILAEIGREYLSVSLIRGGRIIETRAGRIQDEPALSVDALLRTFTNVEVFPSRIIVFNGGHGERLVQAFIAHPWSRSIPFLHVPQISILPDGFDGKAVVFGAATQMGFDILGALSVSPTDIKTFTGGAQNSTHQAPPTESIVSDKKPTLPQSGTASNNFGFVKDKDVALNEEQLTDVTSEIQKEQTVETVDEEEKEEEEKMESPVPGFTVHSPYQEESNIQIPTETPMPTRKMRMQEEALEEEDEEELEEHEEQSSRTGGLLKMPQSLLSLASKVPGLPGGRGIAIILPVILILAIGLIGAYIYLLRATVTISISPKAVDQSEDITFATEGGNDFDNNVIEAKTNSISLSGKTSTNATGKKEVGTKAKGTVTLFNSADVKKQLQEGTTITSSNNLDFTLDKDVTIASATGDIFSGIKSGTAQVAVTAKQIGTEYNIPSNIKFSIGGNSSLAAKNESAFSGGTKKNVTVISQKDIDKVTEELPDSLMEKAKEDLANKLSDGETTLTVVPDFKPSKKDFSGAVGEEAKTLTLSSSVTFAAITYNNKDLVSFTKTMIQKNFDPKLTVSDQDIQNTLKNTKKTDNESVTATLIMKARLLPKIDKEGLKTQLAGKSFADATEILRKSPQVETVTVALFPPLPLLPELLPRQPNNITIDIKTND